jgi:fructokinase
MILCCGEALIDFLPRKTAEGEDCYQHVNGGSVYNTAIALGRLGAKVGLFAGVSRDFFGDQLIDGMKASGVETKFCCRKDNHTTLAFVKLANGHARYSFVDDNSASRNLVKGDLPKLSSAVKALHFGSISLIPEPCGATYETLLKKEAKNRVISIDPNIRSGVIKDKKKHLARLKRMIAMADIVKISDEDTVWMMGNANHAHAAKTWLTAGAKIVVITKGGEGVDVFTRRFAFSADAPETKIADTVGAGDTFTAGFLFHLSRAKLLTKKGLTSISDVALMEAAAFAMRAAAITVSRPGADPPWAHEM